MTRGVLPQHLQLEKGAFQIAIEVNMASEVTLDELRARAERAGLELSEDELKQLLPGVNRAFKQVNELRALVADDDEPASVFGPAAGKKE